VSTFQTLIDIEAIKQLKARYFRCVDTMDLEGWLDVFTDDASLVYAREIFTSKTVEQTMFKVEGKKAIKDYWISNTTRLQSAHHGHMPEIEIISDTEAKGIWAMEDIVEFTDSILHGYGHYWETYRKAGGKWRIATLRLTRTRLSQTVKDRMSI
jgi:hypothetical protein